MLESEKQAVEKIDVAYIANLARLYLSNEELRLFQTQLEQIISYVRKINQLDLNKVDPTFHVGNLKNVFRKDIKKDSLEHSVVMKNAPEQADGQFLVPKIIE